MPHWLWRVALLGAGSLAGVLLAETVARVTYTGPWYERLIADQVKEESKDTTRLNSFGLRDVEYPAHKPPNTRRILFLGDSFTYGRGIDDGSAVFAEQVEKRLNAEYAGQGMRVEVLNGGIPASLTGQWIDLLLKVKGSFEPDAVVVVFFLRDGTRSSSMGAFFDPIRDKIVRHNRASLLYSVSYLFRRWQDAVDRSTISASYTKTIVDSYFGDPGQTEEWRLAQRNLLSIQSIGSASGARVGLVVFPILVDMNDAYPFTRVQNELIRFGRDHDFPTLDLRPAFAGRRAADLWVSAFDQHPNAEGHRLAADVMLPYLRQLLTVPGEGPAGAR